MTQSVYGVSLILISILVIFFIFNDTDLSEFQALPDGPPDSALEEFEIIQERTIARSRPANRRSPMELGRETDDMLDEDGQPVNLEGEKDEEEEEKKKEDKKPGEITITGNGPDEDGDKAEVEKKKPSSPKSEISAPYSLRIRVGPISVACKLFGGCDFGPVPKYVYSADGRTVRGYIGAYQILFHLT